MKSLNSTNAYSENSLCKFYTKYYMKYENIKNLNYFLYPKKLRFYTILCSDMDLYFLDIDDLSRTSNFIF